MPKRRPHDPATRYAGLVVNDRHVASDDVKLACERHLKDLEAGRHIWLPERGARFEYFCADCCVVEDQATTKSIRFELLPWQQFCTYSLFSWAVKDGDKLKRPPGARRFQYFYVETAKGAGKSPLGAAIDLYILTADRYIELDGTEHKQWKPQCFVTASTLEQAISVAMLPAKQMVEMSDRLQGEARCEVLGGATPDRIVSHRTGGYLQALGSHWEGRGQAGRRVSLVHWEEPHEQPTRAQINALEAGFKGRPQPIEMIFTNAGKTKDGPAWEERQRAQLAAKGTGLDNYFAFIATLSEADRPPPGRKRWVPHKRVWKKANPSLGKVIRDDYIHGRIEKAVTVEDRQEVLRLNFGLWGTIDSELCTEAQWRACLVDKIDEDKLKGARLYIAFDVGEVNDLTAIALLFACTDEIYRLRVFNYTPADTLKERHDLSSGNLLEWAEQGYITPCPGSIINYEFIAAEIKKSYDTYYCHECCSDSYKITEMRNAFDAVDQRWWVDDGEISLQYRTGIEMVFHPQEQRKKDKGNPRALWMPGSIDRFERMIKEKEIQIEVNPVLNWNLSSAVIVKDRHMNRIFDKKQSATRNQGKIDGLVAAVSAAGLSAREPSYKNTTSPWEDPRFSLAR